jgi:hypothetical protein
LCEALFLFPLQSDVSCQNARSRYVIALHDRARHAIVIKALGIALELYCHYTGPVSLLQKPHHIKWLLRDQRCAQEVIEPVAYQLGIWHAQDLGDAPVQGAQRSV